jgi:signal transduction histidine kinase
MRDERGHGDCVDDWLASAGNECSCQRLLQHFELILKTLWTRTRITLGEVTLTAIIERVLCTACAQFSFFSPLFVDPAIGISCGNLRDRASSIEVTELRAAIRFVLVEFLVVLGNLTAELVTADLHAELSLALPRAMDLSVDTAEPLRRSLASKQKHTNRTEMPRLACGVSESDAILCGVLSAGSVSILRRAHRRLEHLHEIGKLFASFENISHALDAALGIAAKTLPLRSALLIETDQGHSKMISWPSEGDSDERMRTVKQHLEHAYAYLMGEQLDSFSHTELVDRHTLPQQADGTGDVANRCIVIPLVVGHRPSFGALQIEAAHALDKRDLVFVNAFANQLAVAVDRDRAWRKDIAQRVAEEVLRAKYQALASKNASLYKQAQEAISAREQILAIVSHDLRSPLSTILMTIEVLARKSKGIERRAGLSQAVSRMQRAGDRIMRLVEDLLDFACIESGGLSVRPQAENVDVMIQEIVSSFEGIAVDKRLLITANIPQSLPEVYCDRDRIIQVLSNMVANATKATTEGGTIRLAIERSGRELLFSVSDTGHGISEEDRQHIFERYFRSDEARYHGNGLGLAIAKGIVEAHKGRIWVESTLGRGTSFFFTVPVAEHMQSPAAPS